MRAVTASLILLAGGCFTPPGLLYKPQFHNPFPQLKRVAVCPFFNQSLEPTLDPRLVSEAYYLELQQIPGFEVMPPGVVEGQLRARRRSLDGAEDFQQLARDLNVDVIVVGAVTEFTEYYPPRMGLATAWYAANPSFHPIPPGYGLPWGTSEEEFIPEGIVRDAEFALAEEQLQTQTPAPPLEASSGEEVRRAGAESPAEGPAGSAVAALGALPPDWPDPRGLVPPAPQATRPPYRPQSAPILEHVRMYRGDDAEFTQALVNYHRFRDDERAGQWRAYLERKEDFIRFCCHLHVTDPLVARGGAGETRVVWRGPFNR